MMSAVAASRRVCVLFMLGLRRVGELSEMNDDVFKKLCRLWVLLCFFDCSIDCDAVNKVCCKLFSFVDCRLVHVCLF